MSDNYVAALDVGTTTVRCYILDKNARTIGSATDKVELCYPCVGRVEIQPDALWDSVITVIKAAIADAKISANQVASLGISTQRCSFITWDRLTGKTFHNFITWKDIRADSLVKQWNTSFTMKFLRFGSRCLHTITRMKRFLASSVLQLMNTQVTLRLVWALTNIPALKNAVSTGSAMFGTIDTWLLYRLTGGKSHFTDVSNASATGFFDPFIMEWSAIALTIFSIPKSILPDVCDSAGKFGVVEEHLFGVKIPINCLMADQSASMFGLCCFSESDVKVTMGTGTFLNVCTGRKPHASIAGLYPLVGWKIGKELVYLAEGASNDTGSILLWAQDIGLLKDPSESSDMASAVVDTDGVFFVPAFSGLQAPINNPKAAAGMLGVKPTTTSDHMVRALLESIVFRIVQLYKAFLEETSYTCSMIRVDGGVSKNDFVLQLLADVTGLVVERSTNTETAVLGVGFLAGLYAGFWNSKEELISLRKVEKTFVPNLEVYKQYKNVIYRWEQAVERFLDWYNP